MNVSFPNRAVLAVLLLSVVACPVLSQQSAASPASNSAVQSPEPSGQAVMMSVVSALKRHRTVKAKLRVRTDLLGQPLVGSGSYAQLDSTGGLLLRMELAIQAGEQDTSITQVSDGRSLWEHWRIGDTERVNHIDLRRVARTLKNNPAPLSMNSSSLASGGLPRLTSQLAANFDFDTQPVRTGKLGGVDVLALVGVWQAESLAKAAPNAVDGNKMLTDRLPPHLPHQVEIVVGKSDRFPYRVTYQKWDDPGRKGAESKLQPVVTTEFFEVMIDEVLDATQFQYEQPTHLQVADQTERFLHSLGVAAKTSVSTSR